MMHGHLISTFANYLIIPIFYWSRYMIVNNPSLNRTVIPQFECLETRLVPSAVMIATSQPDDVGNMGRSDTHRTLLGQSALGVPKNFEIQGGNGVAFMRWDRVPDAREYNVYVTGSAGETFVKTVSLNKQVTVQGLANGMEYHVRVSAVSGNVVGAPTAWEAVTPTALAPSTPTSLTASASNGQVALTWGAVVGATRYSIYRGDSSGNEVYLTSVPNKTSFSDINVMDGQSYYYKVFSRNLFGRSEFSETVSATVSDWFDDTFDDTTLTLLSRGLFTDDGQLSRTDVIQILRSVQQSGPSASPVDNQELIDLRALVLNSDYLNLSDSIRYLTYQFVSSSYTYQDTLYSALSISTSSEKFDDMLGHWFYGSDVPQDRLYSLAAPSLTLFGTDSMPAYTEIKQGSLGDCYLLAALAGLVHDDPNAIRDVITDNGDGTYTVRFYQGVIAGSSYEIYRRYVVVNRQLSSTVAGIDYNGGGLWVNLIEKAYAQVYGVGSYDFIGLGGNPMKAYNIITGGSLSYDLTVTRAKVNTQLVSGTPVLLATKEVGTVNLVNDHAYAIIAYDSISDMCTLYNPHGYSTTISFTEMYRDTYCISRVSANVYPIVDYPIV